MKKNINLNILPNEPLNIEVPINKAPMIFNKKINKLNLKPITYVSNDTGLTRHYPPGAQEWYNSIYTFNKNQIKTLPIVDKNLMSLLESFFNMRISHKILKVKRRVNKFRRLSSKKTFVGRGELKHTNSKVIITVYLYNIEKMNLLRKIRKVLKYMYLSKSLSTLSYTKDELNSDEQNEKWIISYNRPYTLKEFTESYTKTRIDFKKYPNTSKIVKKIRKIITCREAYISNITEQVKWFTKLLKTINQYPKHLNRLVDGKIIGSNEKFLIFKHKILNLYLPPLKKFATFNDAFDSIVFKFKGQLRRLLLLLKYSVGKDNLKPFVHLTDMTEKMYNKKVEFNVVDLNQIHLNSDIFTQVVALKLKNRKNSLYKVLRASLRKVKLPVISKMMEKYYEFNKHDLLINKIRNSYVNSMFDYTTNTDPLNKVLLKFYPSSENLEIDSKDKSGNIKLPVSLQTYLLSTLKNIKLRGVRVEAKGRLTRRFTASRSVFKLRWKGGLKNVDSSFKGLSATMLRGIAKSNVQYSQFSSKNRNGAFGVKGWIGSK